jgi:hypothetical protein
MKHDSSHCYEVAAIRPRRFGVGSALRSLFHETSATLPMDFEALLIELDARTRYRT